MKPWMHGYELDYLKSIEAEYDHCNSFASSPFAKYKKNNIAADLHSGSLVSQNTPLGTSRMTVHRVKVGSAINMFPNVTLAHKAPTDVVLTSMIGRPNLDVFRENNIWVYVWAEDSQWKPFLEQNGFNYIGGKITTYGDIYGIWYRGLPRALSPLDPVNFVNIKKVATCNFPYATLIGEQLQALNLNFANHYSNYNTMNAWSAISLRGYSQDISFIEKPSVMSKKWQIDHANENYSLQDTSLFSKFPLVKELLGISFGSVKLHRVRFMKLLPGGGELERHTDQVDQEAGNMEGQIARFHFPIITNPDVHFISWDSKGQMSDVNMKIGEAYVLDIRYPHKVVNSGNTDRIHLVVDVEVNKEVRNLILT